MELKFEERVEELEALKEEVAEMKKKEIQNEKLMFEIAQENKKLSEPLTRALKEVEKLRPAEGGDLEAAAEHDDLVTLVDPQEPIMLHTLRERYEREVIFTSAAVYVDDNTTCIGEGGASLPLAQIPRSFISFRFWFVLID